jgi:patatin-like phospholipase/acyl hydrolase
VLKKYKSYLERVDSPGPKRLLSIDGGGIRGLISIEILARLQGLLREAYGDEDLRLADFFDYVGGTSTGAIIAAGVALGMTIEEIRTLYELGAHVMLKPAPFLSQWRYRYRANGLTEALKEHLGDTRIGDPGLPQTGVSNVHDLKTLLLLNMYNCNTDSPWPISNNPKAKFNRGSQIEGNNLFLPLWQLVRASTAAPTYFPPERVNVGSEQFVFVDGAVTPYNNPAFLLYVMATLDEFHLQWERGEDKLLLVSVGTGSIPNAKKELRASQMTLLYSARQVPGALIYSATVEADKLCRVFGRCLFGGPIDSEIGDLVEPLSAPAPSRAKDFTYVRYDANLTETGLKELGLYPGIVPEQVLPLISGKNVRQLQDVGRAYARKIELAQLGAFDPSLALT